MNDCRDIGFESLEFKICHSFFNREIELYPILSKLLSDFESETLVERAEGL